MLKRIFKLSLVKLSSIYAITEIINKGIPFFLLPILTVYLTPTDYGIVSMFGVLIGFLVPIMGLNVHGAINRKYFDDVNKYNHYITTAIYLLFASSSLTLLIIILFSGFISNISSFPEKYIFLVVIAAFGNSIIQVTLGLWRVREKAIQFGTFQILQTVLNVTVTIILVVGLDFGWLGRVNGQVIAILLFSVIGMLIIIKREKLSFKWNQDYAKDILKFGVPLIPHTIGMLLITMTDRIFVTNMVGISETGIYTVGYQIGMIIGVLQDAFNKAWMPYLYKSLKLNKNVIKYKLVKITYIYFVLILLIAFLLNIIAPFFLKVFIGDAFKDSIVYIIWISIGFAFNGMYKMVGGVIFYEKKTHLLSIVTFTTALLNIIFNYIFIKINGAIGAAQATTLAFFVSFILTWFLASRVHFMPWNIIKYRKDLKKYH
ncbi:flippase [Halobacillus amylolyticus]|uniref:Flippase n=1 Tax=Halobacillus amylolyticus TaxID=2932259 RepID=A0ABY4H8W7_9BACI|nr:flippase [Halobacillus amylolyticus]UOR11321.1 flippase [Halobacillus amylolyticus]